MDKETRKYFIKQLKERDIWFLLTMPIGIYLVYQQQLIGVVVILTALFQQHFLGSGAIKYIKFPLSPFKKNTKEERASSHN